MLLNDRIRLITMCSFRSHVSKLCAVACLVVGLSFLLFNPARVTYAATTDAPNAAKSEGAQIKGAAKPSGDGKLGTPGEAVDVTGTCVDERHKPVANAHVLLFRVDHSDRIQSPPQGRIRVTPVGMKEKDTKARLGGSSTGWGEGAVQHLLGETHSNAKGEYRFANVPADKDWATQAAEHCVIVQAPRKATQIGRAYLREEQNGKRTCDAITISMEKAATIRGRITNSEGKPVAGATVWNCSYVELAKPTPGIACAVTDRDGRYEINDMAVADIADTPPMVAFATIKYESFVLSVDHPDYAPGVIEYTKVPSTVDHVLQRPAHVHGRVALDESGKTAEKTRVHWTQENGMCDSVFTDASGEYSIPRLLPGKYKVAAEREGRLGDLREVTVAPGDYRLDMQLRIGGTLKGRVVEAKTGKAPRFDRRCGIEVHAMLESVAKKLNGKTDGLTEYDLCSGWVNDDGTFTATVEPGHNLVRFDNPQWKLVEAERWNKKGIDIAKGQTVEIELRVSPRVGGWASLIDEGKAAEAEAKGEPAPPLPDVAAEDEANGMSDDWRAMRNMERMFGGWSEEALPKKPMSAKAALDELRGLRAAGEETINGEECLTSVMFNDTIEGSQWTEPVQMAWLQRSILAHIDEFPHLGALMLMGVPGDDSWLEPLRANKQLQMLQICYPKKLTGAGIEYLATLPNLKSLVLCGFTIDNDTVAATASLKNLESLQIYCNITDKALSHLQGNTKLKALSVGSNGTSKMTDASLRYVGSVSNLEELDIGNVMGDSHFTDDGVEHLAGLTKLQTLSIRGSGITDAGLAHLQSLKNLKHLRVEDTSITSQGVDELRKHLPDCEVAYKIGQQAVRATSERPRTEQR